MAKISGILTDGAGQIINNCTIELYAKKTTGAVLTQTQAFQVANNGSYMMNVLPCDYDVKLIINGFPPKKLGTIQVFSDSKDGTLNDFLLNPSESEITPAILQQVIDARNRANKAAEKAADSERNSKIAETNAKTSADNAKVSETNANNFAQSARESATTATNANSSAKSHSDSAKNSADSASSSATASRNSAQQSSNSANAAKVSEDNAKTSEQKAKKSADDAKKWVSTIDTSKLVKKSGDEMTGQLRMSGDSAGIKFKYADSNNEFVLRTLSNSLSFIFYDEQQKAWSTKLAYITNAKSWCFQNINDVTINNKSVLKVGDALPVYVGDQRLMPFRRDELPFGWYFRNGDNFLLDSPQGKALNGLSVNYKRDHNITIKKIDGKQYINVPTAFSSDGRGFFERAVNGTSRQVGSMENDAIRNIWGQLYNVMQWRGTVGQGVFYVDEPNTSGSGLNNRNGNAVTYPSDSDFPERTITFDASRVVPVTADDNRPLNIGMTPVIYLGV
ncbi:prophage tail fiber N-terminal domain-containing protein [Gilliamella sp. Bif1-4]|uniref:prophage tail fiber N-terminal domain-containing protein n=1 Tax=Gilliamella sp. Bif1-4 TaxID=3120233 RepID=UPI00080EB3B8|nr:prophage tail fiber N-terminal domain-containing protein [Gilliamella apicola]OCG39705.1 hypothetical protein A9G25_09880 [Gilliamella apicola]